MMTGPDRHVTGGVDTHGDVHVAAALDSATGRRLGTASFPTTAAGYASLLGWLRGFGEVDRVGVESTGSYGARLTRLLMAERVEVIEVDRPDRKARRFEGKSDPIDAEAAARAVISGRAHSTPKSRDGLVEAIRALEVVHHGAVKDRTRAINQFKALLVSAPEPLRSGLRGLSFSAQLARARRFPDGHCDPVEREARFALKELARRIAFLDVQTGRLEARIGELTTLASPALMGLSGVGPHVAAKLLAAAGDNPHRMRSEAAFAKLCGAPSRHPRARRTVTGSTGAATGGPTTPCSPSCWSVCATIPPLAPTWPAGPPKASPARRSCAASSASSPARCSRRSPSRPPTCRRATSCASYASSAA